jgi:hypothetical protein
VLDGNALYVRNDRGFFVLDLSGGEGPRPMAGFELPGEPRTRSMLLNNDRIYLIASDGVHIVDVSLPARPRQLAELPMEGLNAAAIVGQRLYLQQSGPREIGSDLFAVQEHYTPDRLITYDISISDPNTAVLSGQVESAAFGGAFFAGPEALFRVNPESGLERLSLEDPDKPAMDRWLETEEIGRVSVDGKLAVVVLSNSQFQHTRLALLDVSDPSSPASISSIDLGAYPRDLVLSGTHAFALSGESLETVDFSRPATPTLTIAVDGLEDAAALALENNRLAIAEGEAQRLRVFEWAENGLRPQAAISLSLKPGALLVQKGLAYVSAEGGLEVIDLSDPTAPLRRGLSPPRLPGDFPGFNYSEQLAWNNGQVYALSNASFRRFDVRDPDRIRSSSPSALTARRGLLADAAGRAIMLRWEGDEDARRRFIDVFEGRGKSRWRLLYRQYWPWFLRSLAQDAERLYVAAGEGGLLLLEPVAADRLPLLRGEGTGRFDPAPAGAIPLADADADADVDVDVDVDVDAAIISGPTAPAGTSSSQQGPLEVEKVARWGGRTDFVAAMGNIVYLHEDRGISIYDMSAAAGPRRIGSLPLDLDLAPEWWRDAPADPALAWSLVDLRVDGGQLLAVLGPDPARYHDSFDSWLSNEVHGFQPTSLILAFDLADPSKPRLQGRLELQGIAMALDASEGRRYVALVEGSSVDRGAFGRLLSIDTSGPGPRELVGIPTDRLITRLASRGPLLVAYGWDEEQHLFGLTLVGTSAPEQPELLSTINLQNFWPSSRDSSMVVSDSTVTVFTEMDRAAQVDVRTPTAPVELESIWLQEQSWNDGDPENDIAFISDAMLLGTRLLLLDRTVGTLVEFDLSTASSPKVVGSLSLGTPSAPEDFFDSVWHLHNLAESDGSLYLPGGNLGGMVTVELGPPLRLRTSVDAAGELLAVAAGLESVFTIGYGGVTLFDAAELPAFRQQGSADSSAIAAELSVGIEEVVVEGSHLLLARPGAVDWLNFDDPTKARAGSFAAASNSAVDVAGAAGRAYVLEEQGGLTVHALDGDADKSLLGGYEGPGIPQDIAVDDLGERAFVAAGPAGLSVLDTTDPAQIRELASFDPGGFAVGVAISGDLAVVLTTDPQSTDRSGAALVVIDISSPEPVLRSRFDLPAPPAGEPQFAGGLVLQQLFDHRLLILDLSTPTQPRVAAEIPGAWRSLAYSQAADQVITVDARSGQMMVWALHR